MAAPATSSTTSLVPFFQFSTDSRSLEMKTLLSITSKDLEKKGFEAKIWLIYFENTYLPQYQETFQSALQQVMLPEKRAQIIEQEKEFRLIFKNLLNTLQSLPSNGKAWKNYPGEIEKALFLVLSLNVNTKVTFFIDHPLETKMAAFDEANQKYEENIKDRPAACNHLIHLLADRMSQKYNPYNENCFILKKNKVAWLAMKEKGLWKLTSAPEPEDVALTFSTWDASPGLLPEYGVLMRGAEIILGSPFIGISFVLDGTNVDFQNAISTRTPLQITDATPAQMIKVVYCTGAPTQTEMGNAVSFFALSDISKPVPTISPDDGYEDHPFWEWTQIAIQAIQKVWLEEVQKNPLEKFDFDYIYFPPTTPEEADEKMIRALESALEAPEENALLIEWIADQYDFAYSKEELHQAEQLAAASIVSVEEDQKEVEEISIAPAVLAHAVIQKLKKPKLAGQKPAAQRPKERPLKAASSAAASSSKRQTLSKEELAEQLSGSSMPPKLKEKALGILSGKKLVNKREVDKFFLEIVSFQARASGSQVLKGNKGGSHHSIKLVKQTDKSGKITYRAATLVDKHGRDPGRAASLCVQQSNLLSLFTPLG